MSVYAAVKLEIPLTEADKARRVKGSASYLYPRYATLSVWAYTSYGGNYGIGANVIVTGVTRADSSAVARGQAVYRVDTATGELLEIPDDDGYARRRPSWEIPGTIEHGGGWITIPPELWEAALVLVTSAKNYKHTTNTSEEN